MMGTAYGKTLNPLNKLRILVVDDNEDVADCLVMLLRRLGHISRSCSSGGDCFAALHDFRPQLILLDLSMPGQDGFDICRVIQQSPEFEDVPIIACSALDPYIVEERGVGCNFSHHLVKPVSLAQLRAAIEETASEQVASR